MKYKKLFVLGDERVCEDINLFDSNSNMHLKKPNYLINRIISQLPSNTLYEHINYTKFEESFYHTFEPNKSLVIVHADQTFRDPVLTEIAGEIDKKGAEVWNRNLNDISKRNVDRISSDIGLEEAIIKGLDYEGLVFLKANNNAGDVPKEILPFQYKIMPFSDVPEEAKKDERIFMSKYINPSISEGSDIGRVERIYFIENEHVMATKFGLNKAEIKVNNSIAFFSRPQNKMEQDFKLLNETHANHLNYSYFSDSIQQKALEKTHELQKAIGLNIGAVEFIQDYDTQKLYLIDINNTSYSSGIDDLLIKIFSNELVTHLKR